MKSPLALAAIIAISGMTSMALVHAEPAPLDKTFITKVTEANLAEIKTGKAVLARSKDEKVRKVAQKLVDDHSKANADLAKIAEKWKVSVPTQPSAESKMAMEKLEKQTNQKQFDKTFLTDEIKDHNEAIALFKKEIAEGKVADVKQFASNYLPAIEGHAEMIKQADETIK